MRSHGRGGAAAAAQLCALLLLLPPPCALGNRICGDKWSLHYSPEANSTALCSYQVLSPLPPFALARLFYPSRRTPPLQTASSACQAPHPPPPTPPAAAAVHDTAVLLQGHGRRVRADQERRHVRPL